MGLILVQEANNIESIIGARLRTIVFGSWNCDDVERKFYSFTGETAAGRW